MPRFDITIAGELNLDLIMYGLPDELPPERELLADRMMLTLGGSSAILAHNLAALGSRVGFQTRIGDDDLGDDCSAAAAGERGGCFAGAPRAGRGQDWAHGYFAAGSVAQYGDLFWNYCGDHVG